MKSLGLSCYALAICVAAALLELLGITSLTPELEGIASRVCSPLFYR